MTKGATAFISKTLQIIICCLVFATILSPAASSDWSRGQSLNDDPDRSGSIVFASYAGSNWDIWSLSPIGNSPLQLTQSQEEEQYPALSPDGSKLAYATNLGEIWVVGPGKMPIKIPSLPENCTHPAWSPEGGKIVFVAYTFIDGKEDSDLWIADLDTGLVKKLALLDKIQRNPAWSPDGSRIVYTSAYLPDNGSPIEDLYIINADGTHPVCLVANGFANIQPNWSSNGDTILFASNQTGNMEIWIKEVNAGAEKQLTRHSAYDGDPCWSPDGAQVCFVSTRSGKMDIWVMNRDGKNPRQLTGFAEKHADSKDPHWRP